MMCLIEQQNHLKKICSKVENTLKDCKKGNVKYLTKSRNYREPINRFYISVDIKITTNRVNDHERLLLKCIKPLECRNQFIPGETILSLA